MKICGTERITGNTARMVETKNHMVMNGSVCDLETYSPKVLEFFEHVGGCPLVPATDRWIANVPANVAGQFECFSSRMIDNVDSDISYVAIPEFHPSTGAQYNTISIAKIKESGTFDILARSRTPVPTTHGYIQRFIGQNVSHIFALCGTSNTNRFYIRTYNKLDLSYTSQLADFGVHHFVGFLFETDDFIYLHRNLHATVAGSLSLVIVNKLSGVVTYHNMINGVTAADHHLTRRISQVFETDDSVEYYSTALINNKIVLHKFTIDKSKLVNLTEAVTVESTELDWSYKPANANVILTPHYFLDPTDSENPARILLYAIQTCAHSITNGYGDGRILAKNAEGEWEIIKTQEKMSNVPVRGLMFMNHGRSFVGLTTNSTIFGSYNASEGTFTKDNEILNGAFSIGITKYDDIIVTNADLSVDRFKTTLPLHVKLPLKTPITGYIPVEGLTNAVVVSAKNANNQYIVLKLKLQIDGNNAVFTDTNNREIIIDTIEGDLEVPIHITRDGIFSIKAILV